jgi:alkane 1-monooxygenase
MWKDVKYLVAYTLPVSAFIAVIVGGAWSYLAFGVAFGIIPTIELLLPQRPENHPVEEEMSRSARRFFDFMLYLNLPIVLGLSTLLAWRVSAGGLEVFELIGMVLSAGVIFGACGINVGHELGHRERTFDRMVAELLLVPSMYTHFTVEHNYGHHKHVGTPVDPATARKGETVFSFWIRSIVGTARNAWILQAELLRQKEVPFWSLRHNSVVRGLIFQIIYLILIALIFGWPAMLVVLAAGMIGVLLLESVNYIEHYGLMRQKLPSGRYEPVTPRHSWNSDHQLGRIFLYELTRHSDHHFKSTRKYQVLRHLDESPQLPYGYPASIILALVPPLWMKIVHPRIR